MSDQPVRLRAVIRYNGRPDGETLAGITVTLAALVQGLTAGLDPALVGALVSAGILGIETDDGG